MSAPLYHLPQEGAVRPGQPAGLDPLAGAGSPVRGHYAARFKFMREHLARTVDRASPLLLDLIPSARLDGLARRLAPGPALPWASDDATRPRRSGIKNPSSHLTLEAVATLRLDPQDASGVLQLNVVGGELHAELQIGVARISTWRSPARLVLPDRLSDTLAVAMAGRRLGDLLDHPLLSGREYRVVDAAPFSSGFGTVIRFTAELRPWSPPWARRDRMEDGQDR